jgi:hypothetical protein
MKRIGKLAAIIACWAGLFALPLDQAYSQSVSVDASVSETTIYSGERLQLSIEISGSFNNVSRPTLPSELDGLRLLSNNPSVGRSYSYVNGQSSTSYTYTYQLVAQTKGQHTIPPVNVTIDGEEYSTDPINVEIIDRTESARSSDSDTPDIFLRLEVSDQQPVSGQQIITDVVLFFRDGLEVNSYQPVPGWKAEGFWKEELQSNRRPQATSTVIDGIRYRKARLLQFALFPTKAGELEISPYKIIVSVRTTRSSGDPLSSFFGGMGRNQRQVELSSDPLSVEAQPLPEATDSDYLGAVGNFTISREISTTSATVGESIEITTRFNGTGNVPLISKPEYQLPDGLEVYDPQENSSINRANQKISGSKSFTDVIIARSAGSYTIPQKQVSYYDPDQEEYISKRLPALNFTVKEDPNAAAVSNSPSSMPVSPIMGLASWVSPAPTDFWTNWWLWAGIALPLIILGVGYWQKSFTEKMNTDEAFARSQQAADKASERLDEAITLSEQGDIKKAYNMLQKALTGFISDRLTLPEAGLSNKEYVAALQDHDVDENLVKNVRMLLDKCASISYAPDTTHAYLKSHVGLAQSTLDKLKKVL